MIYNLIILYNYIIYINKIYKQYYIILLLL